MPPSSRFTLPNSVHCSPDLGRERNFLSPRIGCLPARPPASALRRLAPLYRRFSRGLGCLPARPLSSALRRLVPPLWEVFFCSRYLPASQQGLGFTLDFPVLPKHLCFYLSFPSVLGVFSFPGQGIRTSPQMFCPMSESLSGKREGFQDNAIHNKESLFLTRVRAFCRNHRSGAGSEKPLAEAVSQIYKVCISGQ